MNYDKQDFPKVLYESAVQYELIMVEITMPCIGDN